MSILMDSTSPDTFQSCDSKKNVLLTSKLAPSRVQQFMHVHNIVLFSQWRRLIGSPKEELQIETTTIYQLGVLHRGFQTGVCDENLMENIDEIHFVVNLDTSQTLESRGDTNIKHTKVVSNGDSMTIVIRVSLCSFLPIPIALILFEA